MTRRSPTPAGTAPSTRCARPAVTSSRRSAARPANRDRQACTSVSAVQAQYKRVIDQLNLTRIDLDIEGAPLDDTAANDRRNQALANLQAQYAAAGKTLSRRLHPAGRPDAACSVRLAQPAEQREEPQPERQSGQHHDHGLRHPPWTWARPLSKPRTALHTQLGVDLDHEDVRPAVGDGGQHADDRRERLHQRGLHAPATRPRWKASRPATASRNWRSGRSAGTTRVLQRHVAEHYQFTNIFKAITGGGTTGGGRRGGGGTTADHRVRRQVRRRTPPRAPRTAPRSSSTPATAPTPRSGRTAATRCRRSASAWT